MGTGYVPQDSVAEHLQIGRLVLVLAECCEPFPDDSLYYHNRRQHTRAFD